MLGSSSRELLINIVKNISAEELLGRFASLDKNSDIKQDGSVVTEADIAMQARLTQQLKEHWPDIAMLGEEMQMTEQQELLRSKESFWCVDPLDGTSNFASGIPFFAVSVGLIERGQVNLAVIYDPIRDECFTAVRGSGCQLNGQLLDNRGNQNHGHQNDGHKNNGLKNVNMSTMIAVVDLKRLKGKTILSEIVQQQPFRSQRNFGSCALEWCWLAANRFQLYLHGGMKIWDHSAGSLVLEEAGGASSSFDHRQVFKPELTPRPVIAASSKAAHELWQQWINDHSKD